MHRYLRAIGFSKYKTTRDVQPLLGMVIQKPSGSEMVCEGDTVFGHVYRTFGDRLGICTYGEFEEDKTFREDYYFPYAESDTISTRANCMVERHADKNSYGGLCEEPSIGVSLIFYLTNSMEYVRRSAGGNEVEILGVALMGLSDSGKILLPLHKTEKERATSSMAVRNRGSLMEAARNGDEEAMENLTLEDMLLVSRIAGRISQKEDIYSLVDTCFMPFGLESDQYSVIGEILRIEELKNILTGEELYRMLIDCNDVKFGIIINKADLLGEPQVGRRFKGEIWLQGKAEFKEDGTAK